jgi:uncharacterized membrane protein HdeD (DUF308 family)
MVQQDRAGGTRDVAGRMADVGGSRWWWVLYGVLSVIAGISAIFWPGLTLLTLAVVFALQLFILGVFRIVAAFAMPDTSAGMRVLAIVAGILSIVVGVLCLRAPIATIALLTLVLGAFWLVNGIMEIVSGITGSTAEGRGWTIAGGVVGLLGGIVVLSAPVASAVTLAWLLGVILVLHGALALAVGLRRPAAAPDAGGGRGVATAAG